MKFPCVICGEGKFTAAKALGSHLSRIHQIDSVEKRRKLIDKGLAHASPPMGKRGRPTNASQQVSQQHREMVNVGALLPGIQSGDIVLCGHCNKPIDKVRVGHMQWQDMNLSTTVTTAQPVAEVPAPAPVTAQS